MVTIPKGTYAPFIGMVLFVLGTGCYTPLTTLDLIQHGADTALIGCVSSAYYLGFLSGSLKSQYIIVRFGYERSIALFVAIIFFSVLLQSLYFSTSLWMVLRFATGFSVMSTVLAVESWLMDHSEAGNKGTIFSIHMLTYYLAQASSQLFLTFWGESKTLLYNLINFFIIISLLPLFKTRHKVPKPSPPNALIIKSLFKRVPFGILLCVMSGLFLAPIYTMMPEFFSIHHKTEADIGLVMAAVVMGGTLFQFPVGYLLDKVSNEYVMLGVSVFTLLISSLLLIDHFATQWLIILGFLLGGAAFTIYPIGMSYTAARIDKTEMLPTISTLLFGYGIGTSLGPILVTVCSKALNLNGFCQYMIGMSLSFVLLSVFAMYSLRKVQILQD